MCPCLFRPSHLNRLVSTLSFSLPHGHPHAFSALAKTYLSLYCCTCVSPWRGGCVSVESCQIPESLPIDQAGLESIRPPLAILDKPSAFPGRSSSDGQFSNPLLSARRALQMIQCSTFHTDAAASAQSVTNIEQSIRIKPLSYRPPAPPTVLQTGAPILYKAHLTDVQLERRACDHAMN